MEANAHQHPLRLPSSVDTGSTAAGAAAATASTTAHELHLGFHLGYLTDAVDVYKGTMETAVRDGFRHFRMYEPFTQTPHRYKNMSSVAADIARTLTTIGPNATMTLAFSNFPFLPMPDLAKDPSKYLTAWPGMPDSTLVASALEYTNRANQPGWDEWDPAGRTLAAYGAKIKSMLADVAAAAEPGRSGTLAAVEIGNEPNALMYFYGNATEFTPIADAAFKALRSALPQTAVHCCAFDSSLSARDKARVNGDPYEWAPFARAAHARYGALSWHFYRHMGDSSPHYWNSPSTYGNATAFYGEVALEGSIITEWAPFGFNNNVSAAAVGTPVVMVELVRMLSFAWRYKLAAVHVYDLMDHPGKPDRLGFFDINGKPKHQYAYMKTVQQLLDTNTDGASKYDVRFPTSTTTVVVSADAGASMQIVCACGDFDGHGLADITFQLGGGFRVTSKSNFSYDPSTGLIPAGEWIVVKRN
jgi:hypothetical protein